MMNKQLNTLDHAAFNRISNLVTALYEANCEVLNRPEYQVPLALHTAKCAWGDVYDCIYLEDGNISLGLAIRLHYANSSFLATVLSQGYCLDANQWLRVSMLLTEGQHNLLSQAERRCETHIESLIENAEEMYALALEVFAAQKPATKLSQG